MDRLKRFLTAIGIESLRHYLVEKLKPLNSEPDKLIEAINEMKTDIWSQVPEKDKERARRYLKIVLREAPDLLDYLNAKTVFEWLRKDLPFLAGIIYAHPKGMEYLRKVVDNIKYNLLREVLGVEVVKS